MTWDCTVKREHHQDGASRQEQGRQVWPRLDPIGLAHNKSNIVDKLCSIELSSIHGPGGCRKVHYVAGRSRCSHETKLFTISISAIKLSYKYYRQSCVLSQQGVSYTSPSVNQLLVCRAVKAGDCVTDRVSLSGTMAWQPGRAKTRMRQFSVWEKKPASQYVR